MWKINVSYATMGIFQELQFPVFSGEIIVSGNSCVWSSLTWNSTWNTVHSIWHIFCEFISVSLISSIEFEDSYKFTWDCSGSLESVCYLVAVLQLIIDKNNCLRLWLYSLHLKGNPALWLLQKRRRKFESQRNYKNSGHWIHIGWDGRCSF